MQVECSSLSTLPRLSLHPLMGSVPNEVLLIVFSLSSSSSLLVARIVSRRWSQLSNVILKLRLVSPLSQLTQRVVCLGQMLRHLQVQKTPHLDHYRDFLRQSSPSDLAEVVWYQAPPQELQTVCECLVRLHDTTLKETTTRLEWAITRKKMQKSEFKAWFLNLNSAVNDVSIEATQQVENIIRLDPFITYERLREVSLAGYRLLIKVAAVLQVNLYLIISIVQSSMR
jgi:hypothetical protein